MPPLQKTQRIGDPLGNQLGLLVVHHQDVPLTRIQRVARIPEVMNIRQSFTTSSRLEVGEDYDGRPEVAKAEGIRIPLG